MPPSLIEHDMDLCWHFCVGCLHPFVQQQVCTTSPQSDDINESLLRCNTSNQN